MTNVADAVGDGLVADLARPGGNVTGLSTFAPELSGKRLELLKDLLPGIQRVAVLANQDFQGYRAQMKEIESAAQALGLQLQPVEVHGANDLENAFSAITGGRARAIMTLSDPVTFTLLRRIVELAIKSSLPSIHLQVEYADAGGLESYGPSYPDLFRRAATYVDKILKGTKPADLPVEQPLRQPRLSLKYPFVRYLSSNSVRRNSQLRTNGYSFVGLFLVAIASCQGSRLRRKIGRDGDRVSPAKILDAPVSIAVEARSGGGFCRRLSNLK